MALGPTGTGGAPSDPKEKPDYREEAFLREVEDAVRASDARNFWLRYGRWLIATLIVGLAAFAGYIYWSNQDREKAGKDGEIFVEAMEKLKAGDTKAGAAALAKVKASGSPTYLAMAEMVEANQAVAKGDVKTAVAKLSKVTANKEAPEAFRNIALIRKTMIEFDSLPPETVIARLKPLAKPGNPLFGTAGEMTAMAYLKQGKDDQAGAMFGEIAKDKDLPESLRGRAVQMAGSLGVDAVQLEDKQDAASAKVNDAEKGENK